jgi:hypothetical protein
VRDKLGRFFTYTGRGEVTVWNPDGRYLATLGRAGSGPGEFRPGPLSVHPANDGSLWVFDGNQQRFTIFDGNLRLSGTVPYRGGAFVTRSGFLDDGSFLDAERPKPSDSSFTLVRFAASRSGRTPDTSLLVRSFGSLSASERSARGERERRVSFVTGDTFWAGPPAALGRGYELELWSGSGRLLRRIRREVSWYPANVDLARPGEPSPGEVEQVSYLGEGLLLVALRVPNAKWAGAVRELSSLRGKPYRAGAQQAILGSAIDIYVEVLDVAAGVVLARRGPVPVKEAAATLPVAFFRNGRVGYHPEETPNGLQTIRLVEITIERD